MVRWVADHRRHHKYTDKDGDPHSPWRYGETMPGADQGPVLRAHGLAVRPGADLAAAVRPRPARGPDIVRGLPRCSGRWSPSRCCSRPLVGGLVSLVLAGRAHRVLLGLAGPRRPAAPRHLVDQLDLPHVRRAAFKARDKSGNVWWLAMLSFGESWHNLHHADPTCARHGALKGQIDSSRPGDPAGSRSSAGPTTCAGRTRSASTPGPRPMSSVEHGDTQRRLARPTARPNRRPSA